MGGQGTKLCCGDRARGVVSLALMPSAPSSADTEGTWGCEWGSDAGPAQRQACGQEPQHCSKFSHGHHPQTTARPQVPARPASPLSHSHGCRDQETPGAGCVGGQHQPQRSWQPLCSQSSSQRSGRASVLPTGLGGSGGCRHWQHLLGDPKARAECQCLAPQLTVPPVLCPDLSQEHRWVCYSLPGCGKELLEGFTGDLCSPWLWPHISSQLLPLSLCTGCWVSHVPSSGLMQCISSWSRPSQPACRVPGDPGEAVLQEQAGIALGLSRCGDLAGAQVGAEKIEKAERYQMKGGKKITSGHER